MKTWTVFLAVLALAAVPACSDDDDHSHGASSSSGSSGHTSQYPTCKEIIEACHEVDVGEGPIHDCHDQAHGATSDADCVPKKAGCLATCNAAKADAGGDSGHENHDGG